MGEWAGPLAVNNWARILHSKVTTLLTITHDQNSGMQGFKPDAVFGIIAGQ